MPTAYEKTETKHNNSNEQWPYALAQRNQDGESHINERTKQNNTKKKINLEKNARNALTCSLGIGEKSLSCACVSDGIRIPF